MESTSPTPGQHPRNPTPSSSQRRAGQQPQRPPRWLMGVLSLCMALVVIGLVARPHRPGEPPEAGAKAAEETTQATEMPTVQEPVATVSPTTAPTPTPTSAPEPVGTAAPTPAPTPTPEDRTGEKSSREPVTPVDSGSRFSDAVFIGDSRVAGLRLYSGITSEATFLDHTGLTVYDVKEGKKVIRRGDHKVSVLDALTEGTYGKVYLALGVNELGYFNPDGFAETCGEVVELIGEKLPDARIYIQSLIPVNGAMCKANDIPYYITNEGIVSYNEALKTYFADKNVWLLGIPDGLADENGELPRDYSADGVHFKKDGYVLWLNYLTEHTEG